MKHRVAVCISIAAALIAGAGAPTFAQAPPRGAPAAAGGDYTRDLPSVARVESELKGADATDTTARQVAVFTYLQTYIQRIKLNRDYRGAYTSGETALLTAYAQAAYQLSQDFGKAHSPADLKAFQQKEGQYEINNALDWIKQLQGQQAADTYRGTEASLAQSYKDHQDNLQRQLKPQPSGGGIAGDPVLDPTGAIARGQANRVNDPELRRCLELGGSLDQCEGLGGLGAIAGLLIPGAPKPDPNAAPPAVGIVLAGVYRGPQGQAGLAMETAFSHGEAIVLGCGALEANSADTRPYRLRRAGAAVQLVIANEPSPIVVELRPDGVLAGPGLVPVKGRVITGYTTTTRRVMVNGAPAAQQGYNCNGPCSTSSSTPVYGPKTERCALGAMAPVRLPPTAPSPKTGIGMLDALTETKPLVAGFRVTGQYMGASGMKLAFDNDAVTLDCGRAHARVPYAVDNTPGGFLVRVQNPAGAFALTMAPDASLRGAAASATVAGRTVTAIRGDSVSFAPLSQTCPLGVFTPRGQRSTMAGS